MLRNPVNSKYNHFFIKHVMLEFKQILIFFLVGSASYAALYFLSKYLPYQLSQYRFSSTNETTINLIKVGKSDNKLYHLEQLTAMPIVGAFFMNEKIHHLAMNNNWTAVMAQSQIALESILNKHSFEIWYHRGLAACKLQQLEECRQCTSTASYLANDPYQEYYVKDLFEYYEEIKHQIGYKQEENDSNQHEERSTTKNIDEKTQKIDKQKDKKIKAQREMRDELYNTQKQLIQL